MDSKAALRYQNIVHQLVKNSFPELKNKKIKIYEINSTRYGAYSYKFIFRVLIINSKLKDSGSLLIGILAHELSHLENYEKKGILANVLRSILTIISQKFNEKQEKEADKLAIIRGYAKELYLYRKWISRFRNKRLNNIYLSPEEIKSYAKSIKKW